MKGWLKVAIDFLQSPKVMATGKDGALIYLQALALNMRNGRDGKLGAIESTPETFAGLLAAYRLTEATCRKALHRAEEVGLLKRDSDGGLLIVGWDDEWRSLCSTCRQPNPNPVRATCPACLAKRKGKSA